MKPSRKLQVLFNLQPGEGRLVAALLLQYFCLGIAFNFVQTTAFTLFLTEFTSQQLAWVYLVNAVLISLLSGGYLRLSQRLTFRALLALNLGFLLILTLAFWLGLNAAPISALIFALPILFQIVINLGNLSFWPLAGRLFTVRQSKRLFGVVGAGQWIAIVITGFLMPAIIALVGLSNLLVLAAGGLLGALLTMLYITRTFSGPAPEPIAAPQTDTRPAAQNGLADLLHNRYLTQIFALVMVWWLAFFLLDNLFYNRAAAQYPNPDQLASFLGIYLGGLGVVTLLINFFVAGPTISRLGLRASLLILPIGLLISVAIVALAGTLGAALTLVFWVTVIAKLLDMSVGLSIDLSARTILYQPLSADVRPQVQTVADGIVQPFALGLTGLVLLLINALFTSSTLALAYALLIAVMVWGVVAYLLGREYPQMLLQALARRRLSSVELSITDASSRALLKAQLRSPHAGAVLYAMNLLEEIEPEVLAEALPQLLKHPVPEVRCDALDRMVRLKLTALVPAIDLHLLSETTPAVRGAAIQALATLGGVDAMREVLDYLADPSPPIKRGIIVGLLQNGRTEGAVVASSQLFELIDSPRSADRILAAQILSEVDLPSYHQPLLKLLADSDLPVKRAALRAAGRLKYPGLWPIVIDSLRAPPVRSAAAAALVAGGPGMRDPVTVALAQPGIDQAVQLRLVEVCGRLRHPLFIPPLLSQIDQPDVRVRSAALRALSRCGYHASPTEIEESRQRVRNEAEYAARLLASAIDCGAAPATALLQSGLTQRLELCRDRVLYLLSFIYDPSVVLRARDNLLQGSIEKHAYALEVLDTLIAPDLKPIVLPLLDELTPAQRLQRLRSSFSEPSRNRGERLRALACDPAYAGDPWLQACALFTAGQFALSEPAERAAAADIAAAITTRDPIVRETARWVQEIISASPGVNRMLSTLERVIILKTVSIFAETPDEVLAEIAAIADETVASAGQTIFEKGEPGDSLYIIVDGKVRVHDHERFFNFLGERDVFGEMAALDPEPRSASVTTVEETRLLRVDEQALFEVMDDRPEVARGIIRVLSRHLRNRMKDVAELRDRLPEPGNA